MAYFVMTPLGEVPGSPSGPRQNVKVGSRAAALAMGVRGMNDAVQNGELRSEVGKIFDAVGDRLRGSNGLLVRAVFRVTKTGIGQWSKFIFVAPVGIGMDVQQAEAAGMDALECRMPNGYGAAYAAGTGRTKQVLYWVTH